MLGLGLAGKGENVFLFLGLDMLGAGAVAGFAANIHLTVGILDGHAMLAGLFVILQYTVAGGMAGSADCVPVVLVAVPFPLAAHHVELFVQELQSACLVVFDQEALLPLVAADHILHVIHLELIAGPVPFCWSGVSAVSGPFLNDLFKDAVILLAYHLAVIAILPALGVQQCGTSCTYQLRRTPSSDQRQMPVPPAGYYMPTQSYYIVSWYFLLL